MPEEHLDEAQRRDNVVNLGTMRLQLAIPHRGEIALSRDAIVTSEKPTSCNTFSRWPAAMRACSEVARYQMQGGTRYKNATIEKCWREIQ